ncbi:Similar to Cytochrome b5 reductase 4; acc. no. Q502I6 [Pyronema omphalodes CBS 100304]|uniref:Similar to Cytochrome b5 reductase 4 acc. no. Q502I6 n=1 Tax=Pyronema omphalodes (strain CBS 100304) TaxID=1076935 RepID=U4KZL1_PYROM|nr:Similar to Cytochrome b5 reductase 4; acc. no. Q502I6 [Pyronema omphalodes CBS 100304]
MWPFVSNLLRSSQSNLDSSSPDHRVTPSLCVGNPSESSTTSVTSSSPDTTPKARATDHPTSIQAIPEISLLPEDEDDDDLPPMFPAMNSAQRAGVPSSLPVNNKAIPTNMPPPPLPNRNPRMQNPSSWATVPSGGARQNPAAAARAPPRSQLAVQGAGASGVAAGNGLTLPGRQGKSRKKVVLNPGHSPLDWARLQKSGINLRGLPHTSLLKVPPSELAKHKTAPDDVWMGLNGKVYNVSHYLPFHPGGERELMRAAGKDGTKLFNASHHWVNIDNMLEECLIGIMVSEEEATKKEGEGELDMVD